MYFSSIANEVIRTISSFKPVYYFFTKRFWAYKKHQNPKQTIFTLLEVFVHAKSCWLYCFLFAYFCFYWLVLVWFYVLVRLKSFRKKTINWLQIVLITSFTILLTCTPINSPIENLFAHAYDNLQDFFTWLFVKIFSYLFLPWIYFHLYAFVWMLKHQKYWYSFYWKHCGMSNFWLNYEY